MKPLTLWLKESRAQKESKNKKENFFTIMDFLFDKQKHSFHILSSSYNPAGVGLGALFTLSILALYFHNIQSPKLSLLFVLSFYYFTIIIFKWFFDVLLESSSGYHTKNVQKGLKMGMILFIISEIMFFFAFFWAFFHYTLSPALGIGMVWPPAHTQKIEIKGLPLFNTLLLLTSGLSITCSHIYLKWRKNVFSLSFLFLTVLLGMVFLFAQFNEYKYVLVFSWYENLYGSIFFTTTGFHGLHVTIGTIFLLFNLIRYTFTFLDDKIQVLPLFKILSENKKSPNFDIFNFSFLPTHHFGFEAAAWYWHFVDVVWIFLYLVVYWWGASVIYNA